MARFDTNCFAVASAIKMKSTILSLLLAVSSGAVFGQVGAGDDPFNNPPEHSEKLTYQVGALLEYIQLDARIANKLVRKHAALLSAKLLRKELGVMLDEGTAELVASGYTKARSGQRTKVESNDEIIYPTEFDPPEIPQIATLTKAKAPSTAANSTAFDQRKVGLNFEMAPMISRDHRQVEVTIAPRLVRYLGREYTLEDREGLSVHNPKLVSSTIYQPKFYTMSNYANVVVRDADTVLLSMNRPHGGDDKMVMVLLRVDILK